MNPAKCYACNHPWHAKPCEVVADDSFGATSRGRVCGCVVRTTAAIQSAPESETVNHPAHYNRGGIEAIDAIDAACADLKAGEAFAIGNTIKYLFRWKSKGGVEDLKKARWYLDWVINRLEKK